jgi:hypothetical protein
VPTTPAGAPQFKSRASAERELLRSLWYAAEVFLEEGDGGIEGCKIACQAVARFIGVRHQNPELAAPFLALRAALEDVERGVRPDLFSMDPGLRKRSRSSQRKHLQMLASVALDVLMLLGDPGASCTESRASHTKMARLRSISGDVSDYRELAQSDAGLRAGRTGTFRSAPSISP